SCCIGAVGVGLVVWRSPDCGMGPGVNPRAHNAKPAEAGWGTGTHISASGLAARHVPGAKATGLRRRSPLKGLGMRCPARGRTGDAWMSPSQPLQWAYPLLSPGVYPRARADADVPLTTPVSLAPVSSRLSPAYRVGPAP